MDRPTDRGGAVSYSFGERSRANLDTCHTDLQRLAEAVIEQYDFSVIEGHRTLAKQQEYFETGRSTLDGVTQRSKHQESPSLAMDLLPYPHMVHGINVWQDERRFAHFIGIVRGVAHELGIKIRCGFDWDGDGSPANNRFVDYPHVELDR